MVGQKQLKNLIKNLIENGTFPRFSILVGEQGSGTAVFANAILIMLQEKYSNVIGIQLPDVKAETVRECTSDIYKFSGMTNVIMIIDADNMSNAAKNALLKVTEEPPNDTYFIMTLEDENNTLETIRSRGTIFHMDRYTPDEIFEYYWSLEGSNIMSHGMPNDAELVRELCETPGDVNTLVEMGVQEFYDYVQLVVDNISEVQLANSFKIPSKVALKDDAEGYDLKLFWKAFIKVCMERSFDDIEDKFEEAEHTTRMISAAQITSRYLSSLRVKGINKQMLMDNWIIDIRSI